jgi:AcrR family transcriptional regulator
MAGRPKVRDERLDEAAIVGAALKIAQRDMDTLTMRSVSDELQVSVGALYKHVAGREALIALVVEKILSQAPPVSPDVGDGWLALRAQVLGLQALVDLYPGLDQVVIAHSPNSPTANALRREGIAALQVEGLTLDEALRVYLAERVTTPTSTLSCLPWTYSWPDSSNTSQSNATRHRATPNGKE